MELSLETYKCIESLGYWLLVVGLAGDVAVILWFPEGNRKLERRIALSFATMILAGVVVEEWAAGRIDDLRADRELSEDARAELVRACSPLAGRNLFITSYTGDAEAARLGNQIRNALGEAGIEVDNNIGRTEPTRGGVLMGIAMTGPDEAMVTAITKALNAVGLSARPAVQPPTMQIRGAVHGLMIGIKPAPGLPTE